MHWDFTPEQIITGEIPYTLEEYRRDLWAEVREHTDRAGYEALFWALYHLAMGYTPAEMSGRIQRQNDLSPRETREQRRRFELIAGGHQESIEMLKAIIKRQLILYKDGAVANENELPVTDYIKDWIERGINDPELD